MSTKKTLLRLPCRGCTRDCKNYSRCDGYPWRMPEASSNDKIDGADNTANKTLTK